jgi:hypothetical protein
LRDAHALRRRLLRQSKGAHCLPDLDRQAGFDLQLLGVGQFKVGEDVARTVPNLDAFNDSFLHFVV